MTEKVARYASESDDTESENKQIFQSPEKLKTENVQATLTSAVSAESDEYDTASGESGSDEYSDESGSEEEIENEDGSIILDVERQSGDGQEQDSETKKKVDDDEDRSNPQYIPKKGTFYEHDDRTAEDADVEVEPVEEGEGNEDPAKPKDKDTKDAKPTKKWQASQDRWTHDRFDEGEQAPKSRSELVSAYGYDIRNEDGPPKARRRRRYGRGPSKYTRNWEDETAYAKQAQQRKPRPEDFPALGTEKHQSKGSRRRSERQSSEYKENNDRNVERNIESRSHTHDQRDRGDQRQSYKEYKSGSTSNRRMENNRRSSGNRNDNYRQGHNTLEFTNQSRIKGNDSQRDSQRYPQQEHHNAQNSHFNRSNMQSHHQQQAQNYSNDNMSKDSVNLNNSRISTNSSRYQNEHVDDRYSQHKNSKEREIRQLTPVAQQQHQSQQVSMSQQNTPQMQGYVQVQTAPMQNVQANMQQTGVQQQMQLSQVQTLAQNNPSQTKRYSSLRQRTGMETMPQNPSTVSVQQAQSTQPIIPEQTSMMSEAAILQQMQNEKIKQMQSSLAHQKQISYHQAITPQSQAPPSQATGQLPLQTAQGPQYPPSAYYTQPAGAEYQAANVQQTQPVQTQQQQQQMIAAQSQAPQYQYAQNTTPYIQNAYIQPQAAPPAQPPPPIYVPSIPQQSQTYQTQFSGYQNYTPQATTNPTTPIYQSQPPPSITYFAPATTNPPPARVTRRPTNAIPILAPPERSGNGNNSTNNNTKRSEFETDKGAEGNKQSQQANPNVGSAENIDHILDNMFVRRPPLQPAAANAIMKSTSPSVDSVLTENVKNLSLKDDATDEKQVKSGSGEKVG